jgi:hypothetical protein
MKRICGEMEEPRFYASKIDALVKSPLPITP